MASAAPTAPPGIEPGSARSKDKQIDQVFKEAVHGISGMGGGVDPHRVPLPGCMVGGRNGPEESSGQPLATVQSIHTAPFQRLELHPTLPGQAFVKESYYLECDHQEPIL